MLSLFTYVFPTAFTSQTDSNLCFDYNLSAISIVVKHYRDAMMLADRRSTRTRLTIPMRLSIPHREEVLFHRYYLSYVLEIFSASVCGPGAEATLSLPDLKRNIHSVAAIASRRIRIPVVWVPETTDLH